MRLINIHERRELSRTTSTLPGRAAILAILVMGLAALPLGCHGGDDSGSAPAASTHAAADEPTALPEASTKAPPEALAKASPPNAHHPPIDCPLRKAGVDPNKMRPFEDVEAYIAFLDREDRAAWQRPDAVVEALGLTGVETVADVGAGSGYFTFPLARAVPQGKVIAIDIEPEMIRHIHHKVMGEGPENIEVVLAQPDDPRVPEAADLVFICDVLHHVHDRPAWLARLAAEVRSGTRLVLVEFKEGDLPQGPPESVKIPRAQLISLVTAAGFTLESERADLLPYQHFLVFRRQ